MCHGALSRLCECLRLKENYEPRCGGFVNPTLNCTTVMKSQDRTRAETLPYLTLTSVNIWTYRTLNTLSRYENLRTRIKMATRANPTAAEDGQLDDRHEKP